MGVREGRIRVVFVVVLCVFLEIACPFFDWYSVSLPPFNFDEMIELVVIPR